MDIPLARDLLILAAAAIVVALLLNRLKLPTVAGLLAAGALAGPHGLKLVAQSHNLEAFAEVGVALLLFSIGLEFSLQRIARIGRVAALSGVLQISATAGVVTLAALALGRPLSQGLFLGLVTALSSTAIVLRSLEERDEVDAPHGRLILGTLIMQDLAIVPMILLLPLLAGGGGDEMLWINLLTVGAKAVALVGSATLISRYLLPFALRQIDASRSRELFVLSLLFLIAGMTWLSMAAGLSLALGAFLAGIMLADSEFAHRALTETLPVREALISYFFVVIGMLFDWRVLLSSPLPVLAVLAVLFIGKGAIATLSVLLLRLPARVALLFGLGLAQFGEFGYVLLSAGARQNPPLINPDELPVLLCAGVLSMFATPLLLRLAPHLAAGEHLLKPLERLLGTRRMDEPDDALPELSGHVILAGYGHTGRSVAQTLLAQGLPYVVLELNSGTVRAAQAAGEPVYYSDVTSCEALAVAHVAQARALIIVINDQQAVARAIASARTLHPELPVLVRTRYAAHRSQLLHLGATAVVVDEHESAKEMVAQVRMLFGAAQE